MSPQPHITFIYNRYKKASAVRKAAVEMRITHANRQKYISTGITLYPNQWRRGEIVGVPDTTILNRQLDNMLVDVRNILYDMTLKGHVDIFAIPERLEELHKPKKTMMEFFIERAEIRKYGKSEDSQERYDRFIRRFKEYGKIISFEDIDEAHIIAYDKYLKTQGMKNYSKWQNYHRFLNSFILDSIDAGYIKKNPYKWINIKKDKDGNSLSKHLTYKELEKIKNVQLNNESLEKIRDLFVFQTYTCMAYADLAAFDCNKIIIVKGMKVYTGKRGKTGIRFTVPLLKPAINILKKYKYKLPVVSNQKYNIRLKEIAGIAGINKPISSHWARHTGATLLLNEGAPIQVVSKICGHSNTIITEKIYANLLDETVVDAIKKLKKG